MFNNDRFSIIDEFTRSAGGYSIDNGLALVKIDSVRSDKFTLAVENLLLTQSGNSRVAVIFFVTKGEVSLTIDYAKHCISEGGTFNIMSLNIFSQFSASPDFEGYILIVTNDYFEEAFLEKKPITIQDIISAPRSKVLKFSPADYAIIKKSLDLLHLNLRRENHRFRKEIVRNSFCNLIFEESNILFVRDNGNKEMAGDRNTDRFVHKFLDLLIEHGAREHNPAFYADKLCISVQYLSLILKRISGKTAYTWIAGYLINRAKIMLRKPDLTIQQIAYSLNFSDQSAFGKFFRKHTGTSPKKYRDEHTLYS